MSNNDPLAVLDIPNTCVVLSSDLEEMLREIKRLREALEYYADKRRYDNSVAIDRGDGSHDYSTEILEDEGAIARDAIAGKLPHATGCGE